MRAASTEHGWHELFADRYPHAGGEDMVALYVENSEGFEVELSALQRQSSCERTSRSAACSAR